jgi:hypothetical protein
MLRRATPTLRIDNAASPRFRTGINMHPPDPRPSLIFLRPAALAALLLGAGGLLAACDRHSAAEVPDSYGHGSSHEKSYSDHQIDSRNHSSSFSDTRGQDAKEGPEVPAATASPTPGALTSPSPAASKFFQ